MRDTFSLAVTLFDIFSPSPTSLDPSDIKWESTTVPFAQNENFFIQHIGRCNCFFDSVFINTTKTHWIVGSLESLLNIYSLFGQSSNKSKILRKHIKQGETKPSSQCCKWNKVIFNYIRYAPPPDWEVWRSGLYNALPGPNYNYLLHDEHNNYRPNIFAICLLCQRDSLGQCFSTFFKSQNLLKISYNLAEPKCFILLFIAFSGNPARNWRNLWVPQNPGWKTLK